MSKLARIIEQQVTNAVADDELGLPTLPEVALRIRGERICQFAGLSGADDQDG